MNSTDNKFSITEYAESFKRMSFVCTCKKCDAKMTDYVSTDTWLDIAFTLVDSDMLTTKEFKNLHHLAVSQWEIIKATIN